MQYKELRQINVSQHIEKKNGDFENKGGILKWNINL